MLHIDIREKPSILKTGLVLVIISPTLYLLISLVCMTSFIQVALPFLFICATLGIILNNFRLFYMLICLLPYQLLLFVWSQMFILTDVYNSKVAHVSGTM